MSLNWRIGNALVSYFVYIGKCFGRRTCLVLSISQNPFPWWQVALAVVLLLLISGLAILWRKTNPWFFTGWFWYLGMLVPVIGFVQVGAQSRADRYTYLPQIGVYLLLTWAVVDLTRSWQTRRAILSAAGVAPVSHLAATELLARFGNALEPHHRCDIE